MPPAPGLLHSREDAGNEIARGGVFKLMAMDVFERLNRKFGVWYEGLFGGGGGGDSRELRPRDILRRLLVAMEDERREGLDGKIYVPNVYTLRIAVENDDERQYLRTFLDAEELAAAVQRAADQHGYKMRGPLLFSVEEAAKDIAFAGSPPPIRVNISCRFDATVAAPHRSADVAPPAVEMPHVAAAYSDLDDEDSEEGTVAAVPASTLASLVVRTSDGRLQDVFPLTARGARIGRGRSVGNDIVLPGDGMVSKSHARIVYDRGEFRLCDENSTNGTYVNGRRLNSGEEYPLQPADQIGMGSTILLFRPATVPQPVPEPPALAPKPAEEPAFVPSGGFRLVAGDGEVFPLASEMTVGRALTGDIVLIGNGVASQHARLSLRGDSVYVEDMATPGGTCVNGERIPARFPVALYAGDQIRFGEVQVRLERTSGRGSLAGGMRTGGS